MKTEKADYVQSGFLCQTCNTHTKTYNGEFPKICGNCGAQDSLKMEWNQQISMTAVVTALPLVVQEIVV